MPEDDRLAILEELERHRPGLSATAAGTLAGRATPDRPDVPVWEYEEHVAAHPEVALEDLLAVRFPVVFHGGEESTIASVADELRPLPVPPRRSLTVADVLDRWRRHHVAGVVGWDHARRAVVHLRPLEDHRAVVRAWAAATWPDVGSAPDGPARAG